jgi:hypothetical protein
MPLNQAQALSLTTTLRMLEERCDQIERLLAGNGEQGALHQTMLDIPEDIQPAFRADLARLRAQIARLAAEFHLGAEPRSARRALVALLASSWQDLEDARPAKLGRYGSLDPAVAPFLEAGVSELIALVQAMQSLLSENTTNGRGADVTR